MKFEGTRPWGQDKEILAYTFSIGKEELNVLFHAVVYTKKHIPEITETQIFRSRLRTLQKQFCEVWNIAKEAKTENHWDIKK